MHMAAANGQVDCMLTLKRFQATMMPNSSGNLPTHWAAQNGKTAALKFLIDNYELDMLAQNALGRSVVTEAFQSQNAGQRILLIKIDYEPQLTSEYAVEDCIELALSHASSTEERLVPEACKGQRNTEEEGEHPYDR
jgi:ankyrin repeat protein